MTRLSLPAIALLSLTLPIIAQGEAYDLATTAKPDTSVWFLEIETNSQTIDMAGQMMETAQTVKRKFRIDIQSVDDDGVRQVEVEVFRIYGKMDLPMMGSLKFDSLKTIDNSDFDGGMMGLDVDEMTKSLTDIGGRKFMAKVDRFGRAKGMPKLLGDKEEVNITLADQAKKLVEAAFGHRPTEQTAVGGKYKFADVGGSGRLAMENKVEATLVKVDADSFLMKFSGVVAKGSVDTGEDEGQSEDADMAAELLAGMEVSNGKIEGGQKLSRKDGLVTTSNLKATADVSVESQMGAMQMTTLATTVLARASAEKAPEKPVEAPADKKGK
jgi:hypothetical protein